MNDSAYIAYIKQGICEAEEAYARGDVLDLAEAEAYLDLLLQSKLTARHQGIASSDLRPPRNDIQDVVT